MKKIFEELWSGAMGFDPESRGLSAREKAVMKRLATLRDELQAGLSAEQREKLTQLDEGYAELMAAKPTEGIAMQAKQTFFLRDVLRPAA